MTQRRKRSKKWISWLIIIVLLVGAGAVCYLVYDNYFKEKKDEPTSSIEKPQEKEPGVDVDVPEEKKEEAPKKEEVVQYDGDNPNNSGRVTGVITYAGASGDNLLIRMNIDQYLNGGTCSLNLNKDGGSVYVAEASIIDSASTSTCEGFNVPMAGLGSGKYSIIIYINSGDKSGTISGEVEL